MRYAAIDIGSNAVRLLIADIIENEGIYSFKKNTLIRVPLRLGDNAFLDHRISPRKSVDLVKTMLAFRNLMDVYRVSDYMACATSALREAENGPDLVRTIKEQANIELEIIAGQKEANIIYSSHIEQTLDRKKNFLYIDVGGGSTELSVFVHGEMVASRSFDLGTIRILDNQDKDETWQTDTVMVQDFRNLLFYFTQLKNHHDFLPNKKLTYEEYREDNLDGLYFVKAWYVVICLSLSVYIYYLTL